jgi:hypothetical protein
VLCLLRSWRGKGRMRWTTTSESYVARDTIGFKDSSMNFLSTLTCNVNPHMPSDESCFLGQDGRSNIRSLVNSATTDPT